MQRPNKPIRSYKHIVSLLKEYKKGIDRVFTDVGMRYQFLDEYRREFAVKTMCRALSISESGYYAWKQRGPSQRKLEDQRLTEQIRLAYQHGRQVYGSPRIHAELQAQGIRCGENCVACLIQQAGLRAVHRRRLMTTTDSQHSLPVAPNLLQREFSASAPNTKWLADITAVWTTEGWLYLAVLLDVYSRLVVGWAMDEHRDEHLVEKALLMALGGGASQQTSCCITLIEAANIPARTIKPCWHKLGLS